ncbi:MAG: hypothetical protein WC374_02015 [Phycisphaerae bacterium]|jgi:hypothetical protein
MKTALILTAVMLFTCGTAFAQNGISSEQQARLDEIDRYTETLKHSIENNYSEQLNSLPVPQAFQITKTVDASFLGWAIYDEQVLQLNGIDLKNDVYYSELMKKFQSHLTPTIEKLNLPPRLLAVAENQVRAEYADILQQYAAEQARIEKHRQYAINVRLADLENKLKDQVMNPAQPSPDGVVTGIVFSQDDPTALIGSQIVHVGDKIGKIQVASITPDSVAFERGRKQWSQAVGEKANSAW